MEILRWADLEIVPWANGLGATREVARGGRPATGAGGFDWRISIASIDGDVPFSKLPGLDRSLMALSPDGIALVVDEAEPMHLGLHEILRFSGDADVRPVGVTAPSLDLNVMTRRGRAEATLDLQRLDGTVHCAGVASVAMAVVVLEGSLAVTHPRRQGLGRHDTVVARGDDVTLEGTAVVAAIRFTEVR